MNFFAFVRILRRLWWVVILALVTVLASTAYFTYTQTATYRATTTLIIWPDEDTAGASEIIRSLNALERRSLIATYAKISSSLTVRDRARQKTKISLTQMRRYKSRTSVVPDTNILGVSVQGPDPGLVADAANAIAEEAKHYIEESFGIYKLRILDPATPPDRPTQSDISRNIGIGAVLGLVLGVGLVFLVEFVRQSRTAPRSRAEPELEEELTALRG